jgi:transposase
MSRVVLTDSLWTELEAVMRSKGCKKSKNNRNVMEAILWKLRTGAQWREVPEKLVYSIQPFQSLSREGTLG